MEVTAVKGLCSPYVVSWFYSMPNDSLRALELVSRRPWRTVRAVQNERSRRRSGVF